MECDEDDMIEEMDGVQCSRLGCLGHRRGVNVGEYRYSLLIICEGRFAVRSA